MASDLPRPPRLRPISPGTIADNVRASEGVSDEELGIATADADALTRNALQLLRGALDDVDLDDPAFFGRLERRRGHRTARPDNPER